MPAASGWRRRLRRWADEFDPWTPRPGDYVLISVLFLGAMLLYVGERSYAVQLNRRVFQLQERAGTLQTQVDVLVAEAVALADRRRIVTRARNELGMTLPNAADIEYVYYVPDAVRDQPGAHGEARVPGR
jgi:cell division protein FtsB